MSAPQAPPPAGRLAGKALLVTGTTGMAAAAAERFAAEGASVFVTSRREEACQQLVERVRSAGVPAGWLASDLIEDDAAERVVRAVVAQLGRLDGAFNAAGGSGRRFGDGPAHEATPRGWDETIALNARSMFLACGAEIRQLLLQDTTAAGTRGAILNMGSILALHPWAEHFSTHAYAAAKGAIVSMSRAMAARYAGDRIRVNVIAPSLVDTPMSARAGSDVALMRDLPMKQPLVGGMIDATDVAAAAAYLLSDESRAVTGQVLAIDAGWSVSNPSAAG